MTRHPTPTLRPSIPAQGSPTDRAVPAAPPSGPAARRPSAIIRPAHPRPEPGAGEPAGAAGRAEAAKRAEQAAKRAEAAAKRAEAAEALNARLDALIPRLRAAGTVDPDEVAALLEESGISDQAARREYGEPDVFALAERLHARLWPQPTASRHAAAAVRGDWRGLGRLPLLCARLVAAAALAGAVRWLGAAALLPALVGVPLGEALVAWHQGHVRWGLASYDTTLAWRRYLRALGWRALAPLVPPLPAGLALAGWVGFAGPYPGRPPAPGTAPAVTLALAGGVLLAGGYGILLLLASRGRVLAGTGLVAGGAVAVVLVQAAPARMALVAAGYLAGLLLAGYAVVDPTQAGELDV